MRNKFITLQITTVILIAVLAAGCGASKSESSNSITESGNTSDSDTMSSDDETVEKVEENEMETLTFSEDFPAVDTDEGISGVSHVGRALNLIEDSLKGEDSYGEYQIYQGGEMYLPCNLGAQGLSDGGVGLLLFLDGSPQPYRVEGGDGDGDTSYSYMHVFYPEKGEDTVCEIYFTPVAGQEGDMLEYFFSAIPRPNYFPSEVRSNPWILTHGYLDAGGRIYFETDAVECEEVETKTPEVVCNVTYEDIGENESIATVTAFTWYVNGSKAVYKGIIYDVSEGDLVTIRFVITGSPYETFGLTFYLDNEPILIDGGAIPIEIQSGKRTVVEIEFTLSDFDGSSILYAALAPQNYWELLASDFTEPEFLEMTETVYLTSAEDADELRSGG